MHIGTSDHFDVTQSPFALTPFLKFLEIDASCGTIDIDGESHWQSVRFALCDTEHAASLKPVYDLLNSSGCCSLVFLPLVCRLDWQPDSVA